jgi:hypothetical protein
MRATLAPLTDAEFAAVAGHTRPARITADDRARAMSAPSGQRPRAMAYWRDQLVSVRSEYDVDRFRGEARAWWLTGTTLADLVRRA